MRLRGGTRHAGAGSSGTGAGGGGSATGVGSGAGSSAPWTTAGVERSAHVSAASAIDRVITRSVSPKSLSIERAFERALGRLLDRPAVLLVPEPLVPAARDPHGLVVLREPEADLHFVGPVARRAGGQHPD